MPGRNGFKKVKKDGIIADLGKAGTRIVVKYNLDKEIALLKLEGRPDTSAVEMPFSMIVNKDKLIAALQ